MFSGKSFKDMFIGATKRGDIFFAFAIILMLVILIMPLPSWLLDVLLAFSITMSCIVLMMAIFIEKPTEFSAFPLVLLITTMYRLSLNLASTRLILAKGYMGPDAAGEVIKAFGGFIMGNSFVIGVIVFAILVLVNFVVIPKVPAVSPKLPLVLPWMPCPVNKWPLMPICLRASLMKTKRASAVKTFPKKVLSTEPWMVLPSLFAVMPLPVC